MRSKLSDRSGSILLESVIALLILCLTITVVMLLAGVVIQGHQETENAYDEAFALNSLRDQIAEKILQLPERSPASIASAVGSIVASKEGWHFQILSFEDGLLTLRLMYGTDERRHTYEVQIYIGQ